MSETTRLALPLLMPAQAQKHVTVNEALLRLDALSQLVLQSRSQSAPPAMPAEGDCYGVPAGAVGDWNGMAGRIAIFLGGGWDFVRPGRGWRAFVSDEGAMVFFDGEWLSVEAGGGEPGDGPRFTRASIEHSISAGASSTTEPLIPAFGSAWGVTGIVSETIGGATSFRIGVPEAPDRYGTGIGTGEGSWLRGLTGSPLTYWADTPIVLTAEDGAFDGTGSIRLLVYVVELPLPV